MTMVVGAEIASAQAVDTEPPDGAVFSADVTVERAVIDGNGRVTRQLPPSKYRIERFAGGRSRMVMHASTAGPRIGPLADPYAGMIVEFDPAGSGLRIIGSNGQPLPGAPPLPAGLIPPELARGADDGLVTPARDAVTRRGELSRHFGTRTGSVRRLERYLYRDGTRVQEVLVSPATALPVEVNVADDGVLEEHHEFAYEESAHGQLVRTRTRSESRVPGTVNERLVSVTTLANVRAAGGVE
jgi:hypothetical protein